MKIETNATRLLGRYRGALMGLAAFWIVLIHCWLLIVPNHAILGAIEGFVKWNGTIGVEIFLFLSGMGLTYSIRKGSLRSFYAGRLKRILLPYWVMMPLIAAAENWEPGKLLRVFTGISFFTENIMVCLWYIPAAILLYAVFPVYHRLLMRAKDKTAFTGLALCVWMCSVIVLRNVMRSDVWVMYHRIPSFLLGIWIGEIGRERELTMRWEHWLLCVVSAGMGWMLRTAVNRGLVELIPMGYFVAETFIAVPLCLLLAALFSLLESDALRKWLGWPVKILTFFGTFTLELYCIHQWLWSLIYTPLEGHVSYLAINFISIPPVILAGWLFYVLHMRVWKLIGSLKKA